MINKQGQFQAPCSDTVSSHERKEASQSLVFRAITLTDAIWKQGSKGKITITFGSNGCSGCSPDAAWSYIGNQSNNKNPSMNLGFIDPPFKSFSYMGKTYNVPLTESRNYCSAISKQTSMCRNNPNKDNCGCNKNWIPGATVIHEFGHALGMLHEHQNNLQNSNPIKLNINAVKSYYRSIGMGDSGAATNVINTYQCDNDSCEYDGTKYDKQSIMLYYLPDDWIQGKNPTYPNFKLSSDDINWLKEMYPPDSNNKPEITVEFIDRNPEPWKMAWVEKMVTETYGRLIGVKWIFKNNAIKRTGGTGENTSGDKQIEDKNYEDNEYDFDKKYEYSCIDENGDVLLKNITTGTVYSKEDLQKLEEKKELKPEEIAGIIIGIIVFIGIIIMLIFKDIIFPKKNKL